MSILKVNTIQHANGTEAMTIDSSGNLTVPNTFTSTGAITSTGGIYLGGTTAANLLDDYEEGTWTPNLYGSTVAGTFTPESINSGFYIKQGRMVTIFGNVRGTIAGASGSALINGLPFSRAGGSDVNGYNSTYTSLTISYWSGISVDAGGFLVNPTGYLYSHTRTASTSSGGVVAIVNTTHNIHFSGSYYTD